MNSQHFKFAQLSDIFVIVFREQYINDCVATLCQKQVTHNCSYFFSLKKRDWTLLLVVVLVNLSIQQIIVVCH